MLTELGTWLDFLDPTTPFYLTYKNYYTSRPGTQYPTTKKYDYDGNTQCILCPPGYYCIKGSTTPVLCPVGTYCEHQYNGPIACPQGTFNSATGQYICLDCPLGQICPQEGMINSLPCPQGYICDKKKIGTLEQILTTGVTYTHATVYFK